MAAFATSAALTVVTSGGLLVLAPGVAAAAASPLQITQSAGTPADTNGDGQVGVGDRVPVTVSVTYAGTSELTSLSVTDPITSFACAATTLQPNASTSCRGTHVVSRTDVQRGSFTSAPTARGTEQGTTVSASAAPLTVRLPGTASLSLSGHSSTVDSNHDGRTSAGDHAVTQWVVHNTGTQSLSHVQLRPTSAVARACGSGALAPGASASCTTSLVLTQAAIDAGQTVSSAAASGTSPSGQVVRTPTTTVALHLPGSARLSLSQAVTLRTDRNGDGRVGAGDGLVFSYQVTNTGTRTLHGVRIQSRTLAAHHVSASCVRTTLAPGASTSCSSGAYTVSTGQARKGRLVAYAVAVATTPAGTQVTSATSTRTVPLVAPVATTTVTTVQRRPAAPKVVARLGLALYVAKVEDANHNKIVDVGDSVTYGYRVANLGTVALSNLSITDKKLQAAKVTISCPGTYLAAGTGMTCESSPLLITKARWAKHRLTNTATVHGTTATGRSVVAFASFSRALGLPISQTVGLSDPALAMTGADPGAALGLGLGLVLLGGLLVVWSRRPRVAGRPASRAGRRVA